MKKSLVVSLSLMLSLVLAVSLASAKFVTTDKATEPAPRVEVSGNVSDFHLPEDMPRAAGAAQGTTFLGWFTFDSGPSCDEMSWTHVDITAQLGDFFHVTDFTGLGGGSFGLLVPIEGAKSLWCGATSTYPTNPAGALCGYQALPGYGNSWNQAFCTKSCLAVGTGLVVDFLITYDSEPGYDGTTLEVDNCNGNFVSTGFYRDGTGTELASVAVADSLHSGSVVIRFHFAADGAWSDEDGLWDTDGAVIIDSLTVTSSGASLATEDFEGEAEGSNDATDWESCTPAGFGDYAALYPGLTLVLEDPCFSNVTCMWTFFTGSTENYSCGGFPLQTAMPKGNAQDQYLTNEVWSPEIAWTGSGATALYNFIGYRDLPLDNLQFYVWHVRSKVAGCLGAWADRNFVYFGGQKDWLQQSFPFGDLVEGGATHIQLALGAYDMCGVWCGIFGSGACHSHAPLLDDVHVFRINNNGPQWSVRDLDLFQDTFPGDGSTTGIAAIDVANNILPAASPTINPGDSAVVTLSDPVNGLASDPYTSFGAAVYMYVTVWPTGQAGKSGSDLTDDAFRYPVVDSLSHGGVMWYCIRFDTSFTNGTARTGAQPDKFCVDLNDNLFTGGDTICFVFCAESATTADRTYWSEGTGSTNVLADALDNPSEVTILPAGGANNGGEILYVDGMSGRGAQPFFDTALAQLGLLDKTDRYDIRGPSSGVDNRPGARVVDVNTQVTNVYTCIIWDTGDLSAGLIGDGTGLERSDDAFVLDTFLNNLNNPGGVYFCGDDIADWLYNKSAPSASLVNLRNWITGSTVSTNANSFGLGTAPLAVGVGGGCFDHAGDADTLVAFGGCPLINDFDVLAASGTSAIEANYHGNATTGGAILAQSSVNGNSANVGVVLSGFSYIYIRDDRAGDNAGITDRVHHLHDILTWLGKTPNAPVGAGNVAEKYGLSQNYPNPFNPQTTIAFSLAEQTHVSLKVYNVAGQLVRTLVNDVRTAGAYTDVTWDGRNDGGQSVSSGVYFYKLVTQNFAQTKKMVLLK